MDSDRVLVMDAGYAKEYDIPFKLLQNPDGTFRNMVLATGIQESENLFAIAKNKYEQLFIT
jgi:ATP-binding cassette subfamily C (CFTR/MRP) protein 4